MRLECAMPLFSLNGHKPDLAASGTCYVAETAVLIGKVRIKVGASVWFGAVLRGDNEWIEIGERSNVQDNCTFHTDPGFPLVVGRGCTIGHNVILHGCTIGDGTLIGMGAIVMNGAQVGRNCIVGAGALVREKTVIADNALVVGSPARKIRDNDEAAIKGVESAAEIYFQRWQEYAVQLKRLP
jgi:carbonic anhydrase/acetyltransferase-like protein (isoleucine patch superfamily)